MKHESFVHTVFASGATYAVRREHSGVVFDETDRIADLELAFTMLALKAWRFQVLAPLGRC